MLWIWEVVCGVGVMICLVRLVMVCWGVLRIICGLCFFDGQVRGCFDVLE